MVQDPKVVAARQSISIDNSDDQYTTYFDDYTWISRAVTIKAGQGTTAADYETVHTGRVLVSGGVSFTEQAMVVNIDDDRNKDADVLPPNKFFTSTYPNVEDKSATQPIPIVYGDWSASQGAERVPAFQIDSTVGTGGKFKWAGHAVKDLESVWLDDGTGAPTSVAFSAENNGDATFTLDVAYAPDTDTVTVHGKGATDDGTASGTLLTTLPDIVTDILETWLSVPSGNINSAQFTAWKNNLGVADEARRWIGADISSNTLLSEAMVEGFGDLIIKDGKYYPVYRIVPLTNLDVFRDADVRTDGGGRKVYQVVSDPEQNYLNKVAADYAYNPATGRYTRFEDSDTAEITDAGTTERRRVKYNWLYKQVGAESRAERELYNFSTITEMVSLNLGPRALTKEPTDMIRLVYGKYSDEAGTPLQVRKISKDFKAMAARVTAWNVAALAIGRWTSDTAPTFAASNDLEKEENGHWTDAANAEGSIWF